MASAKSNRRNRRRSRPADAQPLAVGEGAEPPRQPSSAPSRSPLDGALRYGLFPLLLLAAVAVLSFRPIADPDLWFHMAYGRTVLETGSFPKADIFSHTAAGNEWISSGWGSSVLLHGVWQMAGATGLSFTVFLLMAAAFLGVYFAVAVRRVPLAGAAAASLALIVAAMAASMRFTPRPEVFGFPCLAALVWVFCRAETLVRPRLLWAAPAIILLWANLHAGVLLGVAVAGVYGVWRLVRAAMDRNGWKPHLPALIACGLCAVAWMLNPYGWRLAALGGKIAAIEDVSRFILEWRPLVDRIHPMPGAIAGAAMATLGLAGAAAWLVSPGRFPAWWRIAAAFFLAYLEFQQRRHAGLASLGIVALLAIPSGSRADDRDAPAAAPFPLPPLAWAALPVLGFVGLIALQGPGRLGYGGGFFRTGIEDNLLPVHATAFLQENPPPPTLFNSYGPGGYLLYHLGPRAQVFIDGRLDIYDPETWADYNAIEEGTMSFIEATRRYGFQTAIVYQGDLAQRGDTHPAIRLARSPAWGLVHFDDRYAVFVRAEAGDEEAREYLRQFGFRYVTPFNTSQLRQAIANRSQREDALAEVRRALAQSAESARAHLLASIAHEELGDTALAAQHRAAAEAKSPTMRTRPQESRSMLLPTP